MNRLMKLLLTFLTLLVLSACGGGASDGLPQDNVQPVASAGDPQTVFRDELVTLNGSASFDADGDTLTYSWTQVSGVSVTLSDPSADNPTFTSPSTPGDVVFELVVNDGTVDSSPSTVTVTVQNRAPVASAGDPQTVFRDELVTLNGSASFDADGDTLTYSWTQVSGVSVTLSDPSADNPTFTSPSTPGDVVFELVVNDGTVDSSPSTVTVTVQNRAPVISSITLAPDLAFTNTALSVADVSSDADGDTLMKTYSWSVNGNILPSETGSVLASSNFVKNDVVIATLTVDDGYDSDTSTVSLTIQDSPPVVTVTGAPDTAVYGVQVVFQVSAADADGDLISIDLDYGPNGMQIDGAGNVSWTPSGPLFENATDFNWGISISAAGETVNRQGTIRVIDALRQIPLVRSGIEVPFRNTGIVIDDFDDDGSNEVLVTDNGKRLFLLRYDTANYVQDWYYPFDLPGYEAAISSLATHDIDSDNKQEFVIGTSMGKIVVLDGVTRKVSQSIDLGDANVTAVRIDDVDGDTQPEIVALASSQLYILDATTLALEWTSSVLALGDSLAIGNVDADATLEIVTANGYVFGFDGTGYSNEWLYGPGFGFEVDVGDLDNNGVDEIVGAVDWTAVRVYNAISKVMVTEILASDLADIAVGDIDGDNQAEILVGDGQWGNVTAYSYSASPSPLLTQDWTINSQDHGVSALSYGDVDNDGNVEFVWGTGITSSGEDSLVVAGLNPTIGVEWQNTAPSQLDGPFVGGHWMTLSPSDTRLVFATARTDSGYGGSRLVTLDPASGRVSWTSEVGSNWNRHIAICGADYDGDFIDEVFVATSNLYDPYYAMFDVDADIAEWVSGTVLSIGVAIAQGDMNNDGAPDLTVITKDGHVYVYDVFNSSMLWSTAYGTSGSDVEVADLDSDGNLEIIIAASDAVSIFTKDLSGYVSVGSVALDEAFDISVGDLDGDGVVEIVAGARVFSAPTITVYNADLSIRSNFSVADELIGVTIENYGSGGKNLLLSLTGGLYAFYSDGYFAVVDPDTGDEVIRSPHLVGKPSFNSVHYVDIDNDSMPEISYGTSISISVTR